MTASPPAPAHRGPIAHRVLIFLFSAALALLLAWLLGFVLRDIGSLPAPSYQSLEESMLPEGLTEREKALAAQLADVERQTKAQLERQALLRDSTSSSQRTMSQLLDIQRLSIEQGVALSEAELEALDETKQLFLTNQKQYQSLNEEISLLNERQETLQAELRQVQASLASEREKARTEHGRLMRRHQIKTAALKLAVLTPLLLLVTLQFFKLKTSPYRPLIYAAAIALTWRVGGVLHEHFPARFFKYILIVAAIAAVTLVLVYLLRAMAFPKREWLLKQYREAYERFLCPVCSFPIRRGPLRYLYWTPRTLSRLTTARPDMGADASDAPYSCPACGAHLFEKCESCGQTRHSLLPSCDKCGATKEPIPSAES